MKLLITGASGFLGKYIVAAALRQGHQVRAVVRPASDETRLPWHNHPEVELARIDLRQRRGITDALQNVDAVIHLAAVKEGDFYTQFAGTVIATENLLEAMTQTNVRRLIGISTFSVYDYLHRRSGSLLDEDSPIEPNPLQRDEYAQTKLIQEQLFRDFAQQQDGQVTIIRPGMVYGRDCLWNASLGGQMGENLWLRIGAYAKMPLTYVENCADAIVAATEYEEAIGQTINIVDDNLPRQRTYAHELIKRMDSPPRTIPVNWTVMRLIANLAWFVNQFFFQGQARLPGILVPAKLHARFKPLRYSNKRAKEILHWTPKYSLETAIERSCSDVELLDVPHQTPASPTPVVRSS